MGKVKEMSMAIEDLRRCADTLNDTADWLQQLFSSENEARKADAMEAAAEIAAPGKTAKSVKHTESAEPAAHAETEPSAPAVPAKPVLTIEQVRAVLADKSRSGLTAEVRELLRKYGAAKLSQIDPANYEALMADAEVLGNG